MLCAELAEILKSGITPGEGFSIIAGDEPDAGLRAALEALYRETLDGGAVAAAMRGAGIFPEYMLRMVAVGEETGALEGVLRGLSDYYRRQDRLGRALRGAVGYPLLLFVIILAVFFVFLTRVLPVFARVFDQIGASMLPLAEAFLRFGLWLDGAKWVLLGILCALAALVLAVRLLPAWRARAGQIVSAAFARTKTGRRIESARTAGVLSLALSGTRDVSEALHLACDFSHGAANEAALSRCCDLVMDGESFARAVSETALLSPVYCRMLAVGERTGTTDAIILDVAGRAEEDMETAVDRLAGRVEPAAVIILSLCVGLLLLSVMLPLVGIMSAL